MYDSTIQWHPFQADLLKIVRHTYTKSIVALNYFTPHAFPGHNEWVWVEEAPHLQHSMWLLLLQGPGNCSSFSGFGGKQSFCRHIQNHVLKHAALKGNLDLLALTSKGKRELGVLGFFLISFHLNLFAILFICLFVCMCADTCVNAGAHALCCSCGCQRTIVRNQSSASTMGSRNQTQTLRFV